MGCPQIDVVKAAVKLTKDIANRAINFKKLRFTFL